MPDNRALLRRVARRDRQLARSWVRTVRATFRSELEAIERSTRNAETLSEWYLAAVDALDPERWIVALRSLYRTATDLVFADTFDDLGVPLGDVDPYTVVETELVRFVDSKAAKIVTTTANYLSRTVAQVPEASLLRRSMLGETKAESGRVGFIRRAARRLFDTFRRDRAPRIAVTEALQATATVQHAAVRTIAAIQTAVGRPQVLDHRWNTVGDDRVRQAHYEASGQTLPVEEPFYVGGERLRYPRDPAGSAGNVVNCRCWETYENRPLRTTTNP